MPSIPTQPASLATHSIRALTFQMEQQLPMEIMEHILGFLDTRVLGRVLADATPTKADAPHWSDRAPKWNSALHQQMKVLDRACRTVIEQAETKAWGLPAIDDARFDRAAAALIDRERFPHVARLLTLQQVRAGLGSIRTDAAEHRAYPVPDLLCGEMCTMVQGPGGDPVFAGHAALDPDADQLQTRIVFCTRDGDISRPSLLDGAGISRTWLGGPTPELLVEFEDDRLGLYRHDTDVIDLLPAEFAYVSAVDVSSNGRFVAAFGASGEGLLVYDRKSGDLFADDVSANWAGLQFSRPSVDNAGNVVVACHPAFAGEGPMQYTLGARSWAPLAGRLGANAARIVMCSNDRYLAKHLDRDHGYRLVLVDRQSPGQDGIELQQSAQIGVRESMAHRLVFSPGNAVVAVAYLDGTIDLFDLADAASRHPAIVEAKRTLTLPNANLHGVRMAFSHDGASFHVSDADRQPDGPVARFLRFDLL